jgi:bis(5'-nucleosyl)-tetraphosphatase (symmetrical)
MAVYAIGDLQGCLAPLQKLLAKIAFDPLRDRLWFVGDLVNRGPDSAGCLRFVQGLGAAAVTVLGNHDLHLLAMTAGLRSPGKGEADLRKVLKAKDCDVLMDWLRRRPLIHHDEQLGYTLVHAGLSPAWTIKKALKQAGKVEKVLTGDKCNRLLKKMYGNHPNQWDTEMGKTDRWRYTINACTRMRFCYPDGSLDLEQKGPPEAGGSDLKPWFDVTRPHQGLRIVFGHWSALGVLIRPDVIALDSGCVWGRSLTGVRLEPEGVVQRWSASCTGVSS